MSIPGSGFGPTRPPRRASVGMRLRERKDWMLAGEVPKACAIQASSLPSEAHRRMPSSWLLREILRFIATLLSFPHAYGPASPILRREGPVCPPNAPVPEEGAVHIEDRQKKRYRRLGLRHGPAIAPIVPPGPRASVPSGD